MAESIELPVVVDDYSKEILSFFESEYAKAFKEKVSSYSRENIRREISYREELILDIEKSFVHSAYTAFMLEKLKIELILLMDHGVV